MKKIMLGNEAVARGLYEAGVRLVSSYPGTPSTEVTEAAAKYDEIYAEWAPNEKVALEVALGAAIGGGRSFVGMKHVGLNVAADPLFITSYTGVNGGMVIGVADDPGMHSSQNEQDSRHYAIAAKLPMVEPSDSGECLEFTKLAYEFSEKFDTPFILRLNTRVSHSQSIVETSDRVEVEVKPYEKDAAKHVMMPGNARPRHVEVEKRLNTLREFAENCPFNKVTENPGAKVGIITSGPSFNYALEAFGDTASYLKLGLVNPLPEKLLKDFTAKYETVYVIEELDPVIESHCKALGLNVHGKDILPLCGEFSQELLSKLLLGKEPECYSLDENIPVRPPVLCPGCPHRGVFYLFNKLKLYVSGDIGCYTLGAAKPLGGMDTTLCMGASVSALHGFNKIRHEEHKSVAVIGDSTFMHSGITGLVDIVYNKGFSTVVVVDNSITGMTGHQQNPCTGFTLKGEKVYGILIENIAKAVGVPEEHIRIVDPNDLAETERVLGEELASDTPSVIICRRPCALLKYVKHNPPLVIDHDKCVGCKACMKIGCPCISVKDGKASIDQTLCNGCGLCTQMCRLGAIGSR
ncbi:MAG: indolepyruvate ferredoxin oxidoreductase subunit alpha [Candidatus Flemingibacterium sp.]|nr:indolepyruvate ferredoxin oxidoreductase subunit alpha [Candidatus Flemingibacterium sp.]